MNTSTGRYAAIPLLIGFLGFSVSCRNPAWPAPEPGPANYLAGPGPGEPLVKGSLEASDVQVRIEDFKPHMLQLRKDVRQRDR